MCELLSQDKSGHKTRNYKNLQHIIAPKQFCRGRQDSKIRDGESDARSDALPLSAEMQRLLDAVFETDEKPLFPESAAVKPPEKPAHVLAIEARMREAGMEHPVLWDGSDRPKIPG